MSNASKITSTIEQIPFADLYVSELNPRSVVNEASIGALAENIRQLGLIQNLAGLRDAKGKKIGIVAGGRRLRALALLQDDARFRTVPVQIAADEATARDWASAENHNREAPHPADEVAEYGAMQTRGIKVPAIAVAFGVTEAHVYRRLALAGLPDAVLAALKADELTLAMASAFTISNDAKHSLQVLENVRGDSYSAAQIKRMLAPSAISVTDRRARFVGEQAYKLAGGTITRDLFSEDVLFDKPEILEGAFVAKLEATAEAAQRDQGWKWVDYVMESYLGWNYIEEAKLERVYSVQGELTEEEATRYDELAELANGDVLDEDGQAELEALQDILEGQHTDAQKVFAGAVIYVDQTGELRTEGGLIRKEDVKAAREAGVLKLAHHPSGKDKPKSPISAKLATDLSRITTGARQTAILDHPDLLLDLLAFQLSGRMGYRTAFGIRTEDVPNWPETEDSGYARDASLTTPAPAPKNAWGDGLAKDFAAFRKQGAETVRGDLTRFLASLLDIGPEDLTQIVDKATKVNIRDVFTPTAANFFSRVNGAFLDALWQELLDLKPDSPTATSFAKLKKADKAAKLEALFDPASDERAAHKLTKAQLKKIDAWLPEGMA